MFGLAVATSIDALAVGVTFALTEVNVVLACSLISGITFIISAIGYKIGNLFGSKYKNKAELNLNKNYELSMYNELVRNK
jgi:putative Mn2+ efflux pump MntP